MLLNTHLYPQLWKTPTVSAPTFSIANTKTQEDSEHLNFLEANINLILRKTDLELELFIVGSIKSFQRFNSGAQNWRDQVKM